MQAAMRAAAVERETWRDAASNLSTGELEHLARLVEGLGDRQIAERLTVAYETARNRSKALRRTLGDSSRAQVVARALQLALARLAG